MKFSPQLRLVLGFLLAALLFLTTGGVFAVGGDAEQALAALAVFIGAIGIVPTNPGEILDLIPEAVARLITATLTAAAFFLPNLDVDATWRGILIAVVGFLASQLTYPVTGATRTEFNTP